MPYMRSDIAANCPQCGVDFYPRIRKQDGLIIQKFCGHSCAMRSINPSLVATPRTEKQKSCQRKTGKPNHSYLKVDSRHEHRTVAENKLGRKLLTGEIVHHKDGDKWNNSPDNLEVVTQAEHMRLHGLAVAGVAPPNIQHIEALGNKLTLKEWSAKTGLSVGTIRQRLYAGHDPEDALSKPPFIKQISALGEIHSYEQWSSITGLSVSCIRQRIEKSGMSPDVALTKKPQRVTKNV